MRVLVELSLKHSKKLCELDFSIKLVNNVSHRIFISRAFCACSNNLTIASRIDQSVVTATAAASCIVSISQMLLILLLLLLWHFHAVLLILRLEMLLLLLLLLLRRLL